jgi:hypothetical protein
MRLPKPLAASSFTNKPMFSWDDAYPRTSPSGSRMITLSTPKCQDYYRPLPNPDSYPFWTPYRIYYQLVSFVDSLPLSVVWGGEGERELHSSNHSLDTAYIVSTSLRVYTLTLATGLHCLGGGDGLVLEPVALGFAPRMPDFRTFMPGHRI